MGRVSVPVIYSLQAQRPAAPARATGFNDRHDWALASRWTKRYILYVAAYQCSTDAQPITFYLGYQVLVHSHYRVEVDAHSPDKRRD